MRLLALFKRDIWALESRAPEERLRKLLLERSDRRAT
jgi:hypothetical protein